MLDNPGAVLDGNDGHSYLLASPSREGDTPDGITRVILGESDLLRCQPVTRMHTDTQGYTVLAHRLIAECPRREGVQR